MSLRTVTAGLLGGLLALGLLQGCEPSRAMPLQIATSVWPGYEPLYLARDLGALDPKAYRLLEMSNSTDVIRALRAGLIPAAALTLDEAFLLLQDGVDLRVVLVMDISNGADVLLARPGLTRLADLKGRRVAVEPTAVGAYLLARALDAAHLRAEDIVVVPITEAGQVQAYRAGAADAVVAFEPARAQLLQAGAKALFDSHDIPNEIFDVLVVRAEVIRQAPETVAQLREAWFGALTHLQNQPGDATTRMAPREGLDPEAFRRSLQGLVFPGREVELQLRSGGMLPPAQRLADLMVARRLLRKPIEVARLFSTP